MKNFMKDFRQWIKESANNKRVIELYNRGLITIWEALTLIDKNNIEEIRKEGRS